MKQVWEILGKHYPPCPIHPQRYREEMHIPNSTMYVCPSLGEVWARRIIFDHSGRLVLPWQVCLAEHPNAPRLAEYQGITPVGSIIPHWESTAFMLNYPLEILKREFLLQYDHAVKYGKISPPKTEE